MGKRRVGRPRKYCKSRKSCRKNRSRKSRIHIIKIKVIGGGKKFRA